MITCKCGHKAGEHGRGFCYADDCTCKFYESEVYEIYITEQQARLDTLRMQLERIIPERDALKKMVDNLTYEIKILKGWQE